VQNLWKKQLTDMLDTTFAKHRGLLEGIVRKEYGRGNPAAYVAWVAERASLSSYMYYLEIQRRNEASGLDDCATEQDVLNGLIQKTRNSAIDLFRRKSGSQIVHGVLGAPRSDRDGVEKKPEYHVPTDENDPVFESLANQQTARRLLNRLSDDDQQFLGILIDAQLEGNYRRPPFKAVAEKLGISTHKVQYRWKKLQESIEYLNEKS